MKLEPAPKPKFNLNPMKEKKMQKYNKFIVAAVTAVITFLTMAFNSPEWLTAIIPLLGALGVYQVPNKTK